MFFNNQAKIFEVRYIWQFRHEKTTYFFSNFAQLKLIYMEYIKIKTVLYKN